MLELGVRRGREGSLVTGLWSLVKGQDRSPVVGAGGEWGGFGLAFFEKYGIIVFFMGKSNSERDLWKRKERISPGSFSRRWFWRTNPGGTTSTNPARVPPLSHRT